MSRFTQLAEFVGSIHVETLPAHVVDAAELVILDTLGCIAGGVRTDLVGSIGTCLASLGTEGSVPLIGAGRSADPVTAAFYYAAAADALDFEDTLIAHPSAAVVAAALATGYHVNASGLEMLRAVVVGYEVGIRIAKAVLPSAVIDERRPVRYAWLATAAAATSATLLNLTGEPWAAAVQYAAASSPSPLWITKWRRPLHWSKNNFGEQTRVGAWAAFLAGQGFAVPGDVLDSPSGYAEILGSDQWAPEALADGLGIEFQIAKTTFKPYPACRYIHTTLDVIGKLRKEHGFLARDVESVKVSSFGEMVHWFDDSTPTHLVDAEFSVPYTVAVALAGLPPGPGWYSRKTMDNPEIGRLASRVTLAQDPAADDVFRAEHKYLSTVEIALTNGQHLKGSAVTPLGDRSNPMSEGDLRQKFLTQMTEYGLDDHAADNLWECGRALTESRTDARKLVGALLNVDLKL